MSSYTAANSFPVKILKNAELMRSLQAGRVVPWHVQLNPTNKCNYHCSFCSCANRDRSLCMPFSELEEMVRLFHGLGMSSVTVTGGGEPIMYRDLPRLLKLLKELDVETGLVCNGSLLHRLSAVDLDRLKWCRVSCSDVLHQQINVDRWLKNVDSAVSKDALVDWAFSYVIGQYPNLHLLKRVVDYANSKNFTHVRVVSDLLDVANVPNMNAVKGGLIDLGVDVGKVIFQGRKSFVHGSNPCYISLLKPVVGADGNLWPCCVDGNESIIVTRNNVSYPIPMKEVKVGDICPSENGSGIVQEVFRKPPQTLIEVTLRTGRSIRVSPDHVMFVAEDVKAYRDCSKLNSQKTAFNYKLKQKKACDLHIGDVIPIMREKCLKRNITTDISEDYAKLLGYYTAEGWMDKDKSIVLMIGKNDVIKEDLFAIIDRLGITKSVFERRTGLQICLHRKSMKTDLKELIASCGARSLKKHVPEILYSTDDKVILAYLHALIQGDGHVSYRSNNPSLELQLTTVSRRLATDVCYLLTLLNINYSFQRNKREGSHIIEDRIVHQHDRYIVIISCYHGLSKFSQLALWKVAHKRALGLDFPKTTRLLFIPITKIEEIPATDDLYDIKVDSTNRFFAGMGFLVHNCGVQYALEKPSKDYEKSMCMGHWRDLPKLIENQSFFDGSKCVRCYYNEYQFIGKIVEPLEHVRFV